MAAADYDQRVGARDPRNLAAITAHDALFTDEPVVAKTARVRVGAGPVGKILLDVDDLTVTRITFKE